MSSGFVLLILPEVYEVCNSSIVHIVRVFSIAQIYNSGRPEPSLQ